MQESLFNQQVRESCAAAMRQGRTSKRAPKDTHHHHNSNNNVAVPSNNRSKSKSPVKKTTSSRVSNTKQHRQQPTNKRSSNRCGKKTTNGQLVIEEQHQQLLQQHPLGRTLARRTEEFNAFSSLDTSNLLEYAADISKNTSNLNQRTVTVNDEIK